MDRIVTTNTMKKRKSRANLCHQRINGHECRFKIKIHPSAENLSDRNGRLCSNPICPRYYICKSCGLKIGKHNY